MIWLISVVLLVQFPAWHSELKEPALLQLWFGFNLWPGNFRRLQVQPKKKKKVKGILQYVPDTQKGKYFHTTSSE